MESIALRYTVLLVGLIRLCRHKKYHTLQAVSPNNLAYSGRKNSRFAAYLRQGFVVAKNSFIRPNASAMFSWLLA